MAGKTLIGGTAYKITGGKATINGAAHKVTGGRTMIDGTVYNINFKRNRTLADLNVGDSVWFNEDGLRTEFIVVHQGTPTSSDDLDPEYLDGGTWLMRKNVLSSSMNYYSTNSRVTYTKSTISDYLTSTYFNSINANVSKFIKSTKIPHTYYMITDKEFIAAHGDAVPVFLLSACEVGTDLTQSALIRDGIVLDYFKNAANSKRIAYDASGTARKWWTRSATTYTTSYSKAWFVNASGSPTQNTSNTVSVKNYIRPAMIFEPSTQIDADNNIVGG